MLDIRYSTRFKKDFKICVKRNYKMTLLQQAIDILRIPDTLLAKNNKIMPLAVIIPVIVNVIWQVVACDIHTIIIED